MDSDFCRNIITQPWLRLGLVLYSGYRPPPWAITATYKFIIRYNTVCVHNDINAGQHLLGGAEGKLTPTLEYLKRTLDYLKR